jgi:hypothetical protein
VTHAAPRLPLAERLPAAYDHGSFADTTLENMRVIALNGGDSTSL